MVYLSVFTCFTLEKLKEFNYIQKHEHFLQNGVFEDALVLNQFFFCIMNI